MKRGELLDKAKAVTNGDREEHYGSPEDNFATIADLWETYLGRRKSAAITITPDDVAVMMILLKVARLAWDNTHEDSWVDIAGYAACGSEIISNVKRT